MQWKALPEFSTSGTNVPVEWLLSLRLRTAFGAITKYLDQEILHLKDAQAVKDAIKTHEYEEQNRKIWQKLKKNLAQNKDVSVYIERVKNDQKVPNKVLDRVLQYQKRTEEFAAERKKILHTFEKEWKEKREELWKLAASETFQEAVFHLNPDFLDRLRPYIKGWRDRKRDKKMRERERTIASYFSRLCGKNSAAGPMGPSSAGCFRLKASTNMQFQWEEYAKESNGIAKREAFFSHWGARELAKVMRDDPDLFWMLPFHIHPMVIVEEGQLSCVTKVVASPFHPSQERVKVSKLLLKMIQMVNGKLSAEMICSEQGLSKKEKTELKLEVRKLIEMRFLVDQLLIPPGVFHPLRYLLDVLNSAGNEAESITRWKKILESFEGDREEYSQVSVEMKDEILKRSGQKFREITDNDPNRGEGSFYADRFILYEDCCRAHKPIDVGGELAREIFEHYTFGLELLCSFWLIRILPVTLHVGYYFEELSKRINNVLEGAEAAREFGKFIDFFTNDKLFQISETIKEDENGLEWLSKVLQLRKAYQRIFKDIDPKQTEIVFSEKDDIIQNYRMLLQEILRDTRPRMPVFVSGPGVEISARNIESINRGDFNVISDSVIFGNSMHFTVLNYFATDREAQMNQTERVLIQLTDSSNARWCNVLPLKEQETKFTPWIGPGLDVEYLNPSCKAPEWRVTARDIRVVPDKKFPFQAKVQNKWVPLNFMFPYATRYSNKLVFDDFEGHFPRIRIDKTVIQRENWKYNTSVWRDILDSDKSEFERFVSVIKRKRELGLPDLVFVDPSGKKKNILIDFQNPFLIDVFLTLVRENETLRFSEMLPDSEGFWVSSPDGKGHYNMEFMPFLYLEV